MLNPSFMTARSTVTTMLLLLLLAPRLGTAMPPDLSSKSDQVEILHQQIEHSGQARLIVELKDTDESLNQFSADAKPQHLARHKLRIRGLQDRFLKRHFGQNKAPFTTQKSTDQPKRFGIIPMIAMTVSSSELDTIAADPDVARIYPDRLDFPSLQDSVPLIGMTGPAGAYTMGATGNGQSVAIVDTGVQANHPFLTGKVIAEACFSSTGTNETSLCPNGQETQIGPGSAEATTSACQNGGENICKHGTHVAGIAAGNNTEPSLPPNGVAKFASVIAVQVYTRFEDSNVCGFALTCVASYESDQIAALEWLYNQVSSLSEGNKLAAINMSLGGGKYQTYCDSDPRKAIIDALRSAGVATVIASGNNRFADAVNAPACISTAITVGATTLQDTLAAYSNQSQLLVDMLAPGSEIYSSIPVSQFDYVSGTSMATPHVAGAFAAIRSRFPQASIEAIEKTLIATGIPVANRGNPSNTKPRIQVNDAIQSLGRNITVSKDTGGDVTSTPSGIDCGTQCSSEFLFESAVSLVASAIEGYRWSEWTGACTGNDPHCQLDMSTDKTTHAHFIRTPLLTVSANGKGVIVSHPGGIDCDTSCTQRFDVGTQIKLIANPGYGFRFNGWSGDCTGNKDCELILNSNQNVTANFLEVPTFLLTVSRSNAGTVESLPKGIYCGTLGKECNAFFADVKLTATPRYGYAFKKWVGCPGNLLQPICEISLSQRTKVSAQYYKVPKVAIKAFKTPFGAIRSGPPGLNCTPNAKSCSASFPKGTNVLLTAEPVNGRSFLRWEGACVGANFQCTLLADEKKTVTAMFQ